MWTVSREAACDTMRGEASSTTSVVRSDDGAVLTSLGTNREGVRMFDYKRGDLGIGLAGSQYDASDDEASGIFKVYLSHGLRMLEIRNPLRDRPNDAELAQLKTDIRAAIPAWGWQLASDVPITEVVFDE